MKAATTILTSTQYVKISIIFRFGVKSLWFVNQKSIYRSHKPKICKTCIFFHKQFFLKYGNFKIISVDNIC